MNTREKEIERTAEYIVLQVIALLSMDRFLSIMYRNHVKMDKRLNMCVCLCKRQRNEEKVTRCTSIKIDSVSCMASLLMISSMIHRWKIFIEFWMR